MPVPVSALRSRLLFIGGWFLMCRPLRQDSTVSFSPGPPPPLPTFFARPWLRVKRKALVPHLCQTLCDSMDCSPPSSSVHGILQAIILEWVAILFSRGFFPTQGSNSGHQCCRLILYHLSHKSTFAFSPMDLILFCLWELPSTLAFEEHASFSALLTTTYTETNPQHALRWAKLWSPHCGSSVTWASASCLVLSYASFS